MFNCLLNSPSSKMAKFKSKSASVKQRRRTKKKAPSVTQSNPFEIRVNKEKYSILGRKLKHDKGLPGLSRSKAIKKRKNTLLQEYKQGNKTSLFIDKRFGEYNNEMSLEEKMLQRFTLEKQKHHGSRGLYNLDEDEELTHYGQSLGDLDNFDDADLRLTDDEEDQEKIEDTHFGGFLEKADKPYHERNEGEQPKSKKEIMEEVVAKSKLKKMERQQAQEEAFQLTQNLDTEWKAVYKFLPKWEEKPMIKADDYDILVRQLLYDTKAKPTGKMKTEEEIAQAELEKLQLLEEERLERMMPKESKKLEHISADDLGERHAPRKDNRFELKYKDGKMLLPEGVNLEEEMASDSDIDNIAADDDDNDEEGSDDVKSGEDEDSSAVEYSDEDDVDDDNDDSNAGESSSKKELSKKSKDTVSSTDIKMTGSVKKELPFTFQAPKNLAEFLKMAEGWNFEQQLCIIDRIRKCHPPKLEEKNKKKIETMFVIILSYVDHLCEQSHIPVEFINKLAKPIFELANNSPHHAAREVQRRLRSMFKRFWVRRQASGGRNAVPGIKEIFLLSVVSRLYPTSDLRHGITTPALIYMAAVLSKSYFQTSSDVLSGLFLSNIIYEFVSLSKRFVPEVINYLSGVLSMASKKSDNFKYHPLFRVHIKSKHSLLLESLTTDNAPIKSRLSDVANSTPEDLRNCAENFKVSSIRTCLHLTKKFTELYRDLPSFLEVFTPIKACLNAIPIENYPQQIQQQFAELSQALGVSIARLPLTLQARKPVPLPLLEPRFDERYEIKPKRKSVSKDSNEREKLKYKYKKEMKGAIREIRKDSQFLAKEKLNEKLSRDAERVRKTREIEGQLAEQQGELNALEKIKRKSKK